MYRAVLVLLLAGTFMLASPGACAQSAPAAANQPAFAVATIKPPDPKASVQKAGFYGKPGGRVFIGGYIKWLVEDAFNLRIDQISGGPAWISSQWLEINAVPPDDSLSRNIKVANAEPTVEQRLMLQSLLRDRFGFKFHFETKEGEVYILTRGSKQLQLKPPKNPEADPRAGVFMREGGIVDGEAEGTNTTIDYLAKRLGNVLNLSVLNQTGITGSYDFYLSPDDPDNHDRVLAVIDVVNRLGLKLKRGRGPIQALVIDRIEQPSEN